MMKALVTIGFTIFESIWRRTHGGGPISNWFNMYISPWLFGLTTIISQLNLSNNDFKYPNPNLVRRSLFEITTLLTVPEIISDIREFKSLLFSFIPDAMSEKLPLRRLTRKIQLLTYEY